MNLQHAETVSVRNMQMLRMIQESESLKADFVDDYVLNKIAGKTAKILDKSIVHGIPSFLAYIDDGHDIWTGYWIPDYFICIPDQDKLRNFFKEIEIPDTNFLNEVLAL